MNLYMTFKNHNFPKDVVFGRWLNLNNDINIEFSDDSDCVDFINQHFGEEYVNLFNYIKSGPNKSDLWRLCKLYVEGGIYADIDLIPLVDIPQIIDDSDICTCSSIDSKSLFQAFMWVKEKKNPLIKECIDSLMNKKNIFKWDGNEPTYDIYEILHKHIKKYIKGGETYYLDVDSKKYKIKILEEYKPFNDTWENCYVRWGGVNLFKSRDIDYYNSKVNNKDWM